jgi:hypothetical protein
VAAGVRSRDGALLALGTRGGGRREGLCWEMPAEGAWPRAGVAGGGGLAGGGTWMVWSMVGVEPGCTEEDGYISFVAGRG